MKRAGLVPALLAAAFPAWGAGPAGSSGLVVDSNFLPLAGVRACLVEGRNDGPCTETDANGEFHLPASDMSRVRITRSGYLPVQVAAVNHPKPILMRRAASLQVFVLSDRSGEALDSGRFWLVAQTGTRTGPFPVRAGGTTVRTLPPGQLAVRVEVNGYGQAERVWATLLPGEETRTEVRVTPVIPAR